MPSLHNTFDIMNAKEPDTNALKPPAVVNAAAAQDERIVNDDFGWEQWTGTGHQEAAEPNFELPFSISELLREFAAGGALCPNADRTQIQDAHAACLCAQAQASCFAAIAGFFHALKNVKPIMANFPAVTKYEMLNNVRDLSARIQDFTGKLMLFHEEVEETGYQPMNLNHSLRFGAQSYTNTPPSVAAASPVATSPRGRPNTSPPENRKASAGLRAKKEMVLTRLALNLVSYFHGNAGGKPSKDAYKVFNYFADAVDCKAPSPSKSPKTEGGMFNTLVKWMWDDDSEGPDLAYNVVKAFVSGCATDRGNMKLLKDCNGLASLQKIALDQAMYEAANATDAQEAEA
jgi:hypothetical protein